MSTMDFSDLDQAFEDSETAEFGSVPDGQYEFVIAAVDFRWTKNDNPIRQFGWRLKITEGEHRGQSVFKTSSLDPLHMKWLKGDLKTCGLQVRNLSDLQNRKDKLLGLEGHMMLVTKADRKGTPRQNIYIQRTSAQKLFSDPQPGSQGPPPPNDNDDIPF